ncbi:hypothetical protein M378DRAFT_169676 [Amanita muscaria Koide BX008]|uniref:RRM domain-containing protein n=1 Tax=Amanita muscaria (strain Koide BX008) TaxID=946122 RepID=A0A0C2WS59_AMAMK|nr:hypothetical protein M378DRAFT_169676 [Amanita muscaria Koide BX008]
MRDHAGRSRCFAFLTFDEPASVNAVMVREHFLDGKVIDPKRAIPRQEHQRATKLFIGGLPGSVTSESMREFFSQFGKVIDSTVMLDRETGRSKGFGFVSFEDTNVQPFLGFGKLAIDGKLIDVKLAQPRYQRDNFTGEERFGGQEQSGFTGATSPTGGTGAITTNTMASGVNGTTAGTTGGSTPFDPQALAALYSRMIQMSAGGMMGGMGGMGAGMNMMGGMGGMGRGMGMGMGGMGGMSGMAGGMGGGMGVGMGTGMAGGMAGGMGAGMGGGMGGNMGRGGGMMGMNQNIPKGPRGGTTPTGPAAGNASVGPQRSQRGGHTFHPYAR